MHVNHLETLLNADSKPEQGEAEIQHFLNLLGDASSVLGPYFECQRSKVLVLLFLNLSS